MNHNIIQSYWEKSLMQFDFAVIGGGILGLYTAIELRRRFPKHHIVILERSAFSLGATTRNAGFACFGSVTELIRDMQLIGSDAVLSIVEKRWKGIQKLRQEFESNSIGYEALGGSELIMDEGNIEDKLEQVNQLLRPIFGHDVFAKNQQKLKESGFLHVQELIFNPLEGQLHSGLLVRALHRKLRELDIQYLSGMEVIHAEEDELGVDLEINGGMRCRVSKCIWTTNAWIPNPHLPVVPGRGQIVMTTPIPSLLWKGSYHILEGYYYFRNVGDRVLIGGGRNLDLETEKTTCFAENTYIISHLESLLRNQILPKVPFDIDYTWSGIMAFSHHHTPIFERLGRHRIYAMNCNGMGVSLSPVLAEEIAESI